MCAYTARSFNTLLTSAQTAGDPVNIRGGNYVVMFKSNGDTITIYALAPDNTTWISLTTTTDASGAIGLTLPQGQIKAGVGVAGPTVWLVPAF